MERRDVINIIKEETDIPNIVEEEIQEALHLICEGKEERGEEQDRKVIGLQGWNRKYKSVLAAACIMAAFAFGMTMWNWETVSSFTKSLLVHQNVEVNKKNINLKLGYLDVKWPDAAEIDPDSGMVKVKSLKALSKKLDITLLDSEKLEAEHMGCSIGLPYDREGKEHTDGGYKDEMITVLGPTYKIDNNTKSDSAVTLMLTMFGKCEGTQKKMTYTQTISAKTVKTGYDDTFGKYYIFCESKGSDDPVQGMFQFQNVRYELSGYVSEKEMENAIKSFRVQYVN